MSDDDLVTRLRQLGDRTGLMYVANVAYELADILLAVRK
jgi:hypothetical protein